MTDITYFDDLWETVREEINTSPLPIGAIRVDGVHEYVLAYARNTPAGRIAVDYRARSRLSLSWGFWDTPEEARKKITGAVTGQELETVRYLSRFIGMTHYRCGLLTEDYLLERGIIPREILLEGPLRTQSELATLIKIPDLKMYISPRGDVTIRGSSGGVDGRGLFSTFPRTYYPQTPGQIFEEMLKLQRKWRKL